MIGVLLPVALVVVVALATTYFVVKRYRNKNPPREQRSDEDRGMCIMHKSWSNDVTIMS